MDGLTIALPDLLIADDGPGVGLITAIDDICGPVLVAVTVMLLLLICKFELGAWVTGRRIGIELIFDVGAVVA